MDLMSLYTATCTEDDFLLSLLANNVAWEVRLAVAQNANTTIQVLHKLSGDDNSYVADCAKKQLAIRLPSVRINVSNNVNTPIKR